MREHRLADKIVASEGDFVGRFLIGLCIGALLWRGTHRERTCANAHHIEANAIDSEGNRRVRQHLKVERHNTIATVDIGECIGICAWMGVGIAIPSIALA